MSKKSDGTNFKGEIVGVMFITLGILALFSIFATTTAGILGKILKQTLFCLFGIGSYLFPFLIMFIGICEIIKRGKIKFGKRFYGILAFLLNILLCVQMINITKFYTKGKFFAGIQKIFSSTSIFHGGILGYILSVPLYLLVGTVGSYIIFTAIYIISIILIFNISIYEFFISLKKKESSDVGNTKKKIDNKLPEDEKETFIKNLNSKIKILDFIKSTENSETKEEKKEPVIKQYVQAEEENEEINKEMQQEIEKNFGDTSIQYIFPEVELLHINTQAKMNRDDKRELIGSASRLEETLSSFGVEAKVIQVTKGPSVTRFELQPNSGVKVSKIVNLSDDIALNLASSGVRIEAPIPGKSAVGIEVPNKELTPVFLREVIESNEFINSNKNLAFCLGKDIAGNCVISDLSKMPHILIAGATGSGKSVCINTVIISLLYKYSPDEVKLLMIDPKVVELSTYNGIPHLLIPVVTDPKKAAGALNWAVNEMTRRYKLFAENNVRNIESYNELFNKSKIPEKLPLIVIIIDELADLMMVCPNDVEDYIGRLTQMARAAGMHLVIATQRPSVDVITGVIKANIPSRVSFAVSSQIDSRTILDMAGAEKLLGKGDMLFMPIGENKPIRIQGAFISEEEVERVVNFIKDQKREVQYKEELMDEMNTSSDTNNNDKDEMLDEAIRIVVDSGQASTSFLQRRLRVGYNRAARIVEQLEEQGIISEKDGSKPRQILISREEINEK